MAAAIPDTMTAVEITKPGKPEVLIPGTRPTPKPGAGEVLVKVAAAGINRPDCLQRAGHYPPPPGASDIPGLELAGQVVAAGPDVTWPKIGEAVCALVAGGGYAEYAVVPAILCLPIPKGLSVVEAASLPETFFTVWSNVFDRAGLNAGENFLVHGGASGIGVTAIQLARARGAHVFATAGTPEKCKTCEALGAERAINYRTEDFVASIKEATKSDPAGEGVDVVLDMVGGDYTPRNIQLLRPDGRSVQIAFLRGPKVELDLNAVMRKRLTVTGSTLRPRPVAFKGAIAAALKREVWPPIEAGKIRPVIHKVLPLAEAAEAHRIMEADTHTGKIVLSL